MYFILLNSAQFTLCLSFFVIENRLFFYNFLQCILITFPHSEIHATHPIPHPFFLSFSHLKTNRHLKMSNKIRQCKHKPE